jgi:hypothetical protein
MNIVGDDYLRTSISQDGYFIKLVFNSRAVHFFPYTIEHRDASLPYGGKYLTTIRLNTYDNAESNLQA